MLEKCKIMHFWGAKNTRSDPRNLKLCHMSIGNVSCKPKRSKYFRFIIKVAFRRLGYLQVYLPEG